MSTIFNNNFHVWLGIACGARCLVVSPMLLVFVIAWHVPKHPLQTVPTCEWCYDDWCWRAIILHQYSTDDFFGYVFMHVWMKTSGVATFGQSMHFAVGVSVHSYWRISLWTDRILSGHPLVSLSRANTRNMGHIAEWKNEKHEPGVCSSFCQNFYTFQLIAKHNSFHFFSPWCLMPPGGHRCPFQGCKTDGLK